MLEIPKPRRRILLVDQDVDLRVGLGLMLKSAGFEVQQASDGTDAIAMHRQQPFDLIVTEILMPGIDGLEILCTLSSQSATPKFVFLSRQSRVPVEVFLRITRHLGARHVLSKPFPPELLLATVREVLGEE
jgi:two-component system chemotaxis response regulator CheY